MTVSTPAAQGSLSRHIHFERERGVYRLLVTRSLAHAVVTVGADGERGDRLLRVFQALAHENIPIFLIKLHRTAVTFAVESVHVPRVEACLSPIALECVTRPYLALVTVVASSMRDLTGVLVSIADSLQEAGARLYGVGDSHNSVQCLIEEAHVEAALQQLKETFDLEDADVRQ
jgi:aspartokinase